MEPIEKKRSFRQKNKKLFVGLGLAALIIAFFATGLFSMRTPEIRPYNVRMGVIQGRLGIRSLSEEELAKAIALFNESEFERCKSTEELSSDCNLALSDRKGSLAVVHLDKNQDALWVYRTFRSTFPGGTRLFRLHNPELVDYIKNQLDRAYNSGLYG